MQELWSLTMKGIILMQSGNNHESHLREVLQNWRLAGFGAFIAFLFIWFLAHSLTTKDQRYNTTQETAVQQQADTSNNKTGKSNTSDKDIKIEKDITAGKEISILGEDLVLKQTKDSTTVSHKGKFVYSTPFIPTISKKLDLSFSSISDIERFTDSVNGVQQVILSEADFRKNTYQNVFVMTKNGEGPTPEFSMLNNGGGALFSDNTTRNSTVLDLMNGSLICEPYSRNQGLSSHVEGTQTMCVVSVPPIPQEGTQEFGGFLTVLLDNDIHSGTATNIPSEVFKLAMSIYNKDVVRGELNENGNGKGKER